MYLDEFSDKESDTEVQHTPPSVTRKSLADFRRNPTVMALRGSEGCEDCQELQHLTLEEPAEKTYKAVDHCPCGCFLSLPTPGPFRTRDKNTFALNVVSAEVLNHHGYSYQPSQIAMFWKKDCRSFLWKGASKNALTKSVPAEEIVK